MAHSGFSILQKTAIIGVCLLALTGCKEDPEAHQPPAPRTLELALTQSTVKQIDRLYSTPGSVASEERIEVSSRTTGYIQWITAHEGALPSCFSFHLKLSIRNE